MRLYAEDPRRGFQPSAGVLTEVAFPDDVRVETGVERGSEVTPVLRSAAGQGHRAAATRASEARARLVDALGRCRIAGIETNRDYLIAALATPAFVAGDVHTRLLDQVVAYVAARSRCSTAAPRPPCRITRAASATGHVGVPPSGPMDALSFRLANRLVGNPPTARRPGVHADRPDACAFAAPPSSR